MFGLSGLAWRDENRIGAEAEIDLMTAEAQRERGAIGRREIARDDDRSAGLKRVQPSAKYRGDREGRGQ